MDEDGDGDGDEVWCRMATGISSWSVFSVVLSVAYF